MGENILQQILNELSSLRDGQQNMERTLSEVKEEQQSMRHTLSEVKDEQQSMRHTLSEVKEEQQSMRHTLSEVKEEQQSMRHTLSELKVEQQTTNQRLHQIEALVVDIPLIRQAALETLEISKRLDAGQASFERKVTAELNTHSFGIDILNREQLNLKTEIEKLKRK
ncbi:chromosome segregation ATPase [Paenibacillus endophyticus]|uniref:Chromosome segregation ATPase n=1 Tax=Paenibacillus endophyticus TaxID=1294268 RepID=A0A7W5CCD8_9BACL|nr:hypothetical protein [Paenibacillus endophyticus]MBB3154650.1 chromosome segregation ATPase [Paenibacillus endophyticus]